jgi:hypothetical protein
MVLISIGEGQRLDDQPYRSGIRWSAAVTSRNFGKPLMRQSPPFGATD